MTNVAIEQLEDVECDNDGATGYSLPIALVAELRDALSDTAPETAMPAAYKALNALIAATNLPCKQCQDCRNGSPCRNRELRGDGNDHYCGFKGQVEVNVHTVYGQHAYGDWTCPWCGTEHKWDYDYALDDPRL
jgi:hypothetical protein